MPLPNMKWEIIRMPEAIRIHHVSLIVSDTERSSAFYHGLLGLIPDEHRPDLGYPGAWLWVDDQQIHLLELPNPDPLQGRPQHGGRDRHLAFAVKDVALLALRLEQAGIAFTRSHSSRPAIFCRDPDGNALELMETA